MSCAECGKKASDGWALYCVDCSNLFNLEQELAKPEQEPIAWLYDWYGYKSGNETKILVKDWIASVYSEVSDPTIEAHNIRPLYTAPPRKEWVGLTDDEVSEVLGSDIHQEQSGELKFIRSIEAKLKEKNT